MQINKFMAKLSIIMLFTILIHNQKQNIAIQNTHEISDIIDNIMNDINDDISFRPFP